MSLSRRGSTEGALSAFVPLFLMLLWLWGFSWSFYRHGPVHGVAAVVLPPYGWYRGIAALWDEPAWREDWDANVGAIGLIVLANRDVPADESIRVMAERERLAKWVRKLPTQQRSELRLDAEMLQAAAVQLGRNIVQDCVGGKIRGANDPTVVAFTGRIVHRKMLECWDGYMDTGVRAMQMQLDNVPVEKRPQMATVIASGMEAAGAEITRQIGLMFDAPR